MDQMAESAERIHLELVASPELYPLLLEPTGESVHFLRLSESDYQQASFLDRRMTGPSVMTERVSWPTVAEAARTLPERAHFLFHTSHAGSTLVSRLLGAHPSLFVLREPALLRTLADVQARFGPPESRWTEEVYEQRRSVLFALWSRTFRPDQVATIKATSFVTEMAEELLGHWSGARAIFMSVRPLNFLRGLLGGAMSDIDQQAAKRLVRLQRRMGVGGEPWRLDATSPGERLMMSMLCEMAAMQSAADRYPGRVLWLDFDGFLADPVAGLIGCLEHLQVDVDRQVVRNLIDGPILRHHAKATHNEYDERNRMMLMQQAEREHSAEIRKGMEWLDRASTMVGLRPVLEAASKRGWMTV